MFLSAQATFGAQAPPFAVKNLAAWYDAGDSSTITIGSLFVSEWTDKSGNGETLSPVLASAQPLYASNAINGHAAVQFSGGQMLSTSDAAFTRLLYPTGTVFVVQSSPNDTQTSSSVWSGASTTARFNLSLPNASLFFDYGDANASRLTASATTYTTTGSHLWVGSGQAAGSQLLRRDGTTIASKTAGAQTTFSCSLVIGGRAGCNASGSYFFTGSIGEVIVFNTLLSATNDQLIEGVLACKWGLQSQLPAGHPYALTCPSATESGALSSVGGLSAWYDATDTSTITTNSGVFRVNDKSLNGNALTQAASSAEPYLSTIGGQQEIFFSGAQSLQSNTSNSFAIGGNPSSMFVVSAFSGTQTGYYMINIGYGTTASGQNRKVGKANGTANAYASEFGADVTSASTWSSSPALAYAAFGASTESIALNGGTLASATITPKTPASTVFYLGSDTTDDYWTGPVYEALIYNAALSTAEQQFIEGYLACKWGLQGNLPSAHPYKSSCPSTSTASLNMTLAVTPSGLQPPGTDLTYVTTFTNTSGTIVYNPVVSNVVPANTWFKVGTATQSLGNTGLAPTVTYSNDGGATFAYLPASRGGGAAAGYDANVTNIRWVFAGALGPASSVSSGGAAYTVTII